MNRKWQMVCGAGLLALPVFILISAASAAADAPIEITDDTGKFSRSEVEDIVYAFRKECRPLGNEYWADVEKVTVTIKRQYADYRFALGWKTDFSLVLKYADRPKYGPAYATGTGVLAGHNLYYYLGGGDTVGYLAEKRSSQYLCGLSISEDGKGVFHPAPVFQNLDR